MSRIEKIGGILLLLGMCSTIVTLTLSDLLYMRITISIASIGLFMWLISVFRDE
jgi:hypothetical protein